MDFLDYKAKKRRGARLMTGYILVFLMIVIASIILVFSAYGFDVDRKTGQVIQNGLLYVDSAPDGAEVYLNGSLSKDRTNARMTLPEGTYQLEIKKSGYRDWKRTFKLEGGAVERVTYPYLLPNDIETGQVFNFGSAKPTMTTQSPDRRWLMTSNDPNFLRFSEFDLNDFDESSNQPSRQEVVFPSDIFSSTAKPRSLELIEWSRDNKNFLVKHTYEGGSEFIVLNRDKPEESININRLLSVNPDKVTLNDKKYDRWYLYFKEGGVIQKADRSKKIEDVLTRVVEYETFGTDTILYTSTNPNQTNTHDLSIFDGDSSHKFKTLERGRTLLNISKYDDEWFVAVSSQKEGRTYVYKDPVSEVKESPGITATPISILKLDGQISALEFSANTQFLMSRSGNNIGIYNAEKDERYIYKLTNPIDKGGKVEWMDGHRLLYVTGGTANIVNFEGINQQPLVEALPANSAFFDRDYDRLYTINDFSNENQIFGLYISHMRNVEDR